MGEMNSRLVRLRTPADIVTARRTCRELARDLGFGSADQTRLATAVTALARNALQYAGGGVCRIADASDRHEHRVRVVVEDEGPGIEDLEEALSPGYSTSGGLGAGLPGAQRLVHEFDLRSRPGGTTVTVAIRRALA